jgi:hypothetical protein
MDFGLLPADILRLILPSHGKAACIAAQVCTSWRAFIQSQLLSSEGTIQTLPQWCIRWQIADLSEANFSFSTLCIIQPQLLHYADVFGRNGEKLPEKAVNIVTHPDMAKHIRSLLDSESISFFPRRSFADPVNCWNNVALMEVFFGDDLTRMESWWSRVEARLDSKQHGAVILRTLRFGSTWCNLLHHASLLSSEVVPPHHELPYFLSHLNICSLAFFIYFTMVSAVVENPAVENIRGIVHASVTCKMMVLLRS